MRKKYFAWSFDDGLEQDKKIIEVLKEFGMGATFHLNSGLFGDKTYEGRIGNLGMSEKAAAEFDPTTWHLLPYVEHFRIPEDELCQVYEGFEIASHTRTHANLAKSSDEECRAEILDDVQALSEKFGQKVVGFAYPYGASSRQSRAALQAAGIRYARIVKTDTGFRFPADPLQMPMSCWHFSSKTFDRLNSFFRTDPGEDDLFFLMFAHGYEFDFGTKGSNWDKLKRICETVAAHDDVICCSIGKALQQHEKK